MEEKIRSRMAKWLKRDNLLILLLAGVLLVVIALPTEKNSREQQNPGAVTGSSGGAVQESISVGAGFSDVEEYAAYLEKRLENTLSQVSGVGAVQVMITLEATQELVLEKDQQTQSSSTTEEDSQGGSRYSHQTSRSENTVYHSSGNNEPYVIKTLLPRVEGVVVVAQGAGTGNINRNITDVVQALFDVEVHKVKVVKMDGSVNISE
ncbi:MAG: stage III sporulation protein AG [Lachnospiraceae bacterium]|nr:stage III sporulation protein AG [Lachnospiraceae bacterium]